MIERRFNDIIRLIASLLDNHVGSVGKQLAVGCPECPGNLAGNARR